MIEIMQIIILAMTAFVLGVTYGKTL